MGKINKWLGIKNTENRSVTRFLIKGYLALTILCLLVLLLPIFQENSVGFIDHLFYAVSIVSTTGLVPSNFADTYNLGGQIISLFFIQLGGVGYMALGSFIVLKQFNRLPFLSVKLLRLEFNLPKRYPLAQFIYSIFIFTLLIESIGAIILYFGFSSAGIENPMWNAIFHSVSAFCTAGFSLFNDSFMGFNGYPLIKNTIIALSLLGSIGFIVLLDFFLFLTRKRKTITLTSKIIIISTMLLWIVGALLLFLSHKDIYVKGMDGINISLFQSMTAHTTVGFNSYDIGAFSKDATFILILLMMVGASPSGTGGGIKTTSITALFAVLTSVLRRGKKITFLKKVIPSSNIYLAVSSTMFYTLFLCISTWILLLIEGDKFSFQKILFECASALSTVGISTGITGELSNGGKFLILVLMFVGRIGVLTFGFALIGHAPILMHQKEEEDIAI